MSDSIKEFPSYFPKGCPPDDATEDEIRVYRLIIEQEVSEKDFITYYEMNPQRYNDNVLYYGLSVYANEDDCIRALIFPKSKKKKFSTYALATTNGELGKIKKTLSGSHHTWWIYEDVEIHRYFNVCERVAK